MDVWQWYMRRGRLSRETFWWRYLLPAMSLLVMARWVDRAQDLPLVALVTEGGWVLSGPTGPIEFVVSLVFLLPLLTASVARLHDRGNSAWLLLLLFVPVLGFLVLFVAVAFWRGERQPNQYGPVPPPLRRPHLPAPLRRPRVAA